MKTEHEHYVSPDIENDMSTAAHIALHLLETFEAEPLITISACGCPTSFIFSLLQGHPDHVSLLIYENICDTALKSLLKTKYVIITVYPSIKPAVISEK